MRLVDAIAGVLVVTTDLDAQQRFFESVFRLRAVAAESLTQERVEALWGLRGHRARTVVLLTPGTSVGVRLVAFDPSSSIAVRENAAGVDADALKVVDFLVRDFGQASATARAAGFEVEGPARYSVPADGRFTEGHVRGPDGVIAALLEAHDTQASRFVHASDRAVSEILGFSSPVEDLDAPLAFYEALGLDVVYRYDLESTSFQHLIGAGRSVHLRGRNVGTDLRDPMIGLVHYGLPARAYRSLAEAAVLPNRGLLAVRFWVASAGGFADAARRGGGTVVHAPRETSLAPHGPIRSTVVRAPHGVLHHAVELIEGGLDLASHER